MFLIQRGEETHTQSGFLKSEGQSKFLSSIEVETERKRGRGKYKQKTLGLLNICEDIEFIVLQVKVSDGRKEGLES